MLLFRTMKLFLVFKTFQWGCDLGWWLAACIVPILWQDVSSINHAVSLWHRRTRRVRVTERKEVGHWLAVVIECMSLITKLRYIICHCYLSSQIFARRCSTFFFVVSSEKIRFLIRYKYPVSRISISHVMRIIFWYYCTEKKAWLWKQKK